MGSSAFDDESRASAARLPTFLVIGAAKAGTTSLHVYLREHPDVFMPTRKEAHFFSDETEWRKGITAYARLFRRAGRAIAVGEASTSYTRHPQVPDVPRRIASVVPDVRLVYLVRHPIERIVSQYRFRLAKGWERRPIDEALRDDRSYLDTSRYGMQLERYLPFFDPERILVIRSEDLHRDRDAALARTFRFLGVDGSQIGTSTDRRMNTSDGNRLRAGPARARRMLRTVPGYERVVDALPPRVRSSITVPFRDRDDERPPWPSPDVEQRLREVLRVDLERLRPIAGPGFVPWDLGGPP